MPETIEAPVNEPSFFDALKQGMAELDAVKTEIVKSQPTQLAPDPTHEAAVKPRSVEPTEPKAPVAEEKKPFNPLLEKSEVPELGKEKNPVAETKPAEPEVEEKDPEFYKAMTKEAQKAFTEMRKQLKEAKKGANSQDTARLTELETKLKDAATKLEQYEKGVNPDLEVKLKTLESERDEYLKQLRAANITLTPEFKNNIAEPIKQLTGELKELAVKYKLDASELVEAFSEPNVAKRVDKLDELLGNLSPIKQKYVEETGAKLAQKLSQRDLMLKEAETTQKVIEDNRRKQAESTIQNLDQQTKLNMERAQAEYQTAADKVFDELGKQIPLFRKFEGQDEFNKNVDELKRVGKGLNVYKLPPAEQALASYYALAFPQVYKLAQDQANKIAELEGILTKRSSSTPGAGSGTSGTNTNVSSSDDGGDFVSAISKAFK